MTTKTNKGIASFKPGRENTMAIIFTSIYLIMKQIKKVKSIIVAAHRAGGNNWIRSF